ncbi:Acetylcholinesterase 1 [Talaromyces islandicus]|uniref:Carboxylic ester hydrolase n=1 Tax=Talaromyces islandicus TaxID=28573 RepID=A0A0U1LPJ5_TALIS|nr:Acetylcholinesterase 1 [Talaromyces islandicus]
MKSYLSNVFLAVPAAAALFGGPSVTIHDGILEGGHCENGKGGYYYKSIPFAEPPVGSLRFMPPKPYGKYHHGKLDATKPANSCIQFGSSFLPGGAYSEDCLYIDVWTPAHASKHSKLPVKVWVYGGSDTNSGISDALFDGCNIADDGAVLVSINYRLGPLGFMGLKSAGIRGNQGIQDVLLGLEWVQKNVEEFGGDKKKVVLFGQSAGATDIFAVASLPQAPSLMNAVIAESIPDTQVLANWTMQSTSASYAKALNCSASDKSCLQSKTVTEIQAAYANDAYLKQGLGSASHVGVSNPVTHSFWPYVDGYVIAEDPSTRGPQVPMVIGYNQREGVLDTLAKYDSIALAENATAAQYKTFLVQNFGPAGAKLVENYYPLSLFEALTGNDTGLAVVQATAQVVTDAHFKCPGYQGAVEAAKRNIPVWTYEFTHNSTCVWLDTMSQAAIADYGATHTAEIPFLFGNLYFNFTSPCNSTPAEYRLGEQMRELWTAMAENANPSTDDVQWPAFKITANGSSTPGLVIGNSTEPGLIDFSACALWEEVNAMILANNGTAVITPSASARPTATSTSTPTGGAPTLSTTGGLVGAMLMMGLAIFA